MTFLRVVLTALVMLSLASAVDAQSTLARSAAADPSKLGEGAELDVSRLPIDLERIHRELQQSTIREERQGLNLRYFVDVYGQAPPIVIFGPEDRFFNKFATMFSFAPPFAPIPILIGGGGTRMQPVYVDDVAEAICYDGTPNHSERQWAAEHGWWVREFTATWDTTRALIDADREDLALDPAGLGVGFVAQCGVCDGA